MKATKMSTIPRLRSGWRACRAILVLALGLMVWPASVAEGRQYLTVNGASVTSITLEVGQSCTVEVVSDDSRSYEAFVGFDNGVVLGTFSHLWTRPSAGDSADVVEVNQAAFYGYSVKAAGTAPPPSGGVHFIFRYVAQQFGETYLKLYQNDPPPSAGPLLDSVHITVTPPQHLRVNGQEAPSIRLELGRSCTVEVVSTISTPYTDYVGFDNGRVLGTFSYQGRMPEAGNLADVTEYNVPAFYGYGVTAAGVGITPGVHFIFEYVAQELGTTYVKLYDSTLTTVIDTVRIRVIPLGPKPMGTAFTYQGSLLDVNSPADGLYDFQFKLYDNADPVFAAQEGNTIDINDLDVIEGQFTVELDFGSDVFAGDARWLEFGVRPGDFNDPCEYTVLSPRVELTPTPYSLYAKTASEVEGGIGIGGSGTANYVAKFIGPKTLADSTIYESAGNVGIGTASPSGDLYTSSKTLEIEGTAPSIVLDDTDGTIQDDFEIVNVGDKVLFRDATDNVDLLTIGLWGNIAGDVGIGTTTLEHLCKLTVNGRIYAKGAYFEDKPVVISGLANPMSTITLDAAGRSGEPSIEMYDKDFNTRVQICAGDLRYPGPVIEGAWMRMFSADNRGTIKLNADDGGNGKITTDVLQINGGSDLSEQFEVSDEGGKVKPGMVVCIDAANSGSLVVSKKTYDRTVAGIVSGAGGVKPGMLMGQKGTEADGEHPVALTGRVYCWADASNGPIEPGDLLTTSDMAGHAMKVTDYTKAQGAILGKAMSSLESGKGLVLVLVSLQ